MENEAAKRRLKLIAAHFAASDDMPSSHVLPMNCSGSLNSPIPRCDNRMYFSRQGSSSQACFMRQVSVEQVNRAQTGVLNGLGSVAEGSSNALEVPLFSRPATMEPKLSAPKSPKFSRPSRKLIGPKQQLHSKKKIQAYEVNVNAGTKWSPRMDVVESRSGYVVTVELPGVGIDHIRVEVNDSNLTVTGKRSTWWWQAASCSNESISAYHRREILQGPYQAVWPLPADVDKDHVSAEFVDGFLRITVPKN